MNNEDKLNKVITNDFDITNNYTSIRKKMERGNKMNKIFKYSLVPMAIVITLASVFLLNKRSNTNNVLDSDVKNNDVIIVNSIDNNSDNAKLDIDGRSEDITTDDLYKIYPLLKDIVVPNDYNINGIIKCYLFNDDTGKYDKLYGYNIVIDSSIVEDTSQFTYTKQRVIDKIKYKFGTIKIYARDYYNNGQLICTQCYII